MKNLTFVFVLFSYVLSAQIHLAPPEQLWPQTFAVIVGISSYSEMPLRYCDDDAFHYYSFLKSAAGGSVPDKNIVLLVDERATKVNIVASLEAIAAAAKPTDKMLFFFAGHGMQGGLVPVDVNLKTGDNILHHWEIKSIFKKSQSNNKLAIVDACHSGGMEESWYIGMVSDLLLGYQNTGIAMFLACGANEVSKERSDIQQGFFTYFMVQGLGGKADFNNNLQITLQELYSYVYHNVRANTGNEQNPMIVGDYNPDYIIR